MNTAYSGSSDRRSNKRFKDSILGKWLYAGIDIVVVLMGIRGLLYVHESYGWRLFVYHPDSTLCVVMYLCALFIGSWSIYKTATIYRSTATRSHLMSHIGMQWIGLLGLFLTGFWVASSAHSVHNLMVVVLHEQKSWFGLVILCWYYISISIHLVEEVKEVE